MGKKIIFGIMLLLLLESIFFSSIMLVKGETARHDLEVSLKDTLKAPHHLSSGNSTILNATVANNGNVTEENVNLQLLINGTVYLSSTTPELLPNETFWTAYPWAPENGIWNLTAYTPLLSAGESDTTNNIWTKLVKVSVDEPPIVNFIYLPPPPLPGPIMNEDVTFDASTSYDPDWGNITTFSWDFNGTIIDTNDSVMVHRFQKHGNATVTLTLYDTEGKDNSTSNPLTIYARPVANFSISGDPYVDYPLTFNASNSYDPDNDTGPPTHGIVMYTWDFDDGNTTKIGDDEPPIPTINHTYAENKTYEASLTVTDSDNLNQSFSATITIGAGYPIADWRITAPRSYGPYYVDETLTFDASKSEADGGTIISYLWNWDDGTPNEGNMTVNHSFTKAGTYNVTLTITDDKGLDDSESKTIEVKRQVYMSVEPTSLSKNPEETFKVNISITDVIDLKHFFFNLTWSADILECVDPGVELGDFLGNPGDINLDREYPTGRGYVWVNATRLLPDGITGNGTLAVITFKVLEPGNSTLSFSEHELTNSIGLQISHETVSGTFYTTIPVANFFLLELPVVNATVIFDASSSYDPDGGYIVNYTWDFGDGTPLNSTSNATINHTYKQVNSYSVKLTVTDNEGESKNITKTVNVVAGRDVAVINVKPYANETAWNLKINVTVTNGGYLPETFNVTVYANSSAIGNPIRVENLPQGENITLTFTWETRDWIKGNYTISATADTVPNESNTTNNTDSFDGTVKVVIPGDVNRDGVVDVFDAVLLANATGATPSAPDWDPKLDINGDLIIDIFDAVILADHAGETLP